jgi:hypothetical protein
MKKAKNKRSGPERGSLRVQAWIYVAVNPLISALETEARLLGAYNPTWRFISQDLEYVWEPRRYLDPNGRIVLDDLLLAVGAAEPLVAGYTDLSSRIQKHAAQIERIRKSAATYHHSLVTNPQFTALIDEALQAYLNARYAPPVTRGFDPEPWGAYPRDVLKDIVAENVVNQRGELPGNRTDQAFWSYLMHHGYLGRVAEINAPTVMRRVLEQEERATVEDAKQLGEHLSSLRFDLCQRYDVPAAPVAGLTLD